ncbi:hypothetical protein BGZ58_009119 [Dissophora ornata]|nr:hypothetical protein BGZ58_009119 [Dissophora ornata]
MPSLSDLGAHHVATFLVCIIFVQLIFYFHEPLLTTFFDPSSLSLFSHGQQQNVLDGSVSQNHHPSVPLTVEDYAFLDEIADVIAANENHRVFRETGLSDIHGTSIKNDAEGAKRIRDQILCWTRHGSWVRQDEGNDVRNKGAPTSWSARKHLGDRVYGKCDTRFSEALNRETGPGEEEHHSLGDYDQKHERWIVREAVKYKWVPDESICGPTGEAVETNLTGLRDDRSTYQPFDANKFCEYLGERNVLIAGDLTQYQIHDSILSAVGTPFICNGETECLSRSPHELCQTSSLKFFRNDIISVPWAVDPEHKDFPDGSTVEQAWATDPLLQEYTIVFLNRGQSWRPDDVFLQELVFTMRHLWTFYPDTIILYRATYHASNCAILKEQGEDEAIAGPDGQSIVPGTTIQKPLTTAPGRRGDVEDQPYRPTLADVQRQNRLAKVVVESAGGIYLDTEEMFALRQDGRMGDGDCSRFCAPGPVDAYADLLYNTMRILQA